jgi:hypothetical protein
MKPKTNYIRLSTHYLKAFYLSLILLAFSASLYTIFKPGIDRPSYPVDRILSSLNRSIKSKLISVSNLSLNKDSADRKLSDLYHYKYIDGTEILGVMVRVKKQGDFKIEGYGLLTKNLQPIYMENSIFSNTMPYSIIGNINKDRVLQTCIVPGTTKIDQADVRLSPLVSIVKNKTEKSGKGVLSKVLGLEKNQDYSCLVLSYKPSSRLINNAHFGQWTRLVLEVQKALLS